MDWSSDAVLDFRPRNHCRYLKGGKRLVLWPAWAWRVVAPEVKDRKLNPLQRVVLRLSVAGCRQHVEAGEFLGLDPELIAYVAQELIGMSLLDGDGTPTVRASRFLEESEVDVGELRVGWVFQDGDTGKLFPRFVTDLPLANVAEDSGGHPLVTAGSKGRPFSNRAFLVPGSRHTFPSPTPRDILDAARRHRRHTKRHQRAQIDVGIEAIKGLDQISLVSDRPERVHLLSFVYVPESESEELPWYVAEPFGFGASPALREQLERLRTRATGSFRQMLDGITGAALDQHREHWAQMQTLLRDEARRKANEALPRGAFADDEPVRKALEEGFLELARLEQASQAGRVSVRDLDTAYLRLRQALEAGLVLCHSRFPPGDVWKKLYARRGPMRRDPCMAFIERCANATGFDSAEIPRSILRAKPGQIQWACKGDPGRIRPTAAAFLLAACDEQEHPLREVAARHPSWLMDVDHIANAAGGQVHAGQGRARGLDAIKNDMEVCVAVLRTLMNALGSATGGTNHG